METTSRENEKKYPYFDLHLPDSYVTHQGKYPMAMIHLRNADWMFGPELRIQTNVGHNTPPHACAVNMYFAIEMHGVLVSGTPVAVIQNGHAQLQLEHMSTQPVGRKSQYWFWLHIPCCGGEHCVGSWLRAEKSDESLRL
jgi:hypothetical protein